MVDSCEICNNNVNTLKKSTTITTHYCNSYHYSIFPTFKNLIRLNHVGNRYLTKISYQPELEKLVCFSCHNIKSIARLNEKIEYIDIAVCRKIRKLYGAQNLKLLDCRSTNINYIKCEKLEILLCFFCDKLLFISKMKELQEINYYQCPLLYTPYYNRILNSSYSCIDNHYIINKFNIINKRYISKILIRYVIKNIISIILYYAS